MGMGNAFGDGSYGMEFCLPRLDQALAGLFTDLKERGIWLVGLDGYAEQTLHETDLKGPLAIVMGAEGQGLRRLSKEHCDFLVKIPMAGTVESLNVSVATGVCLYEINRQRHNQ